MFGQITKDLDLYPEVGKKEMNFNDVEYQVKVGHWIRKMAHKIIKLCDNDLHV